MLVLILLQHRMARLVVDRQVDLGQIDQPRIELAVLDREGVKPLRDRGADAARAGAAEDDVEPGLQGRSLRG
jgi:hypothetical protein